MTLPRRVTICEVGTRDGFQIEPDSHTHDTRAMAIILEVSVFHG